MLHNGFCIYSSLYKFTSETRFFSLVAMAQANLTGYGHQSRLVFNGDETRYELWETKVLAYMRLKKLKDVIHPESTTVASVAQREEAFSELVQFLDDRSLSLILRDAKDDGRKAMKILRQHYAGHGSQRILSLYTTLTTLQKQSEESLTDYILRAETAAAAVKSAGKTVDDDLLVAMVLKGLPANFKPFVVVITQQEKVMSFPDFKIALRNYEENDKATCSSGENSNIMKANYRQNGHDSNPKGNDNSRFQKNITCFRCHETGHKQQVCPNTKKQDSKRWCSRCRSNTHNDKSCRKNKDAANLITHDDNREDHSDDSNSYSRIQGEKYSFVFGVSEDSNRSRHYDENGCGEAELLLVDSGASSHIFNDESKFISFDENYEPMKHSVELADGTITTNVVKKRGTAVVKIRDENNEIKITKMEDALLIPSYPQSIFSVKAATKRKNGRENNTTVILGSESGELISNGVRFPIRTVGNLYYLNKVNNAKQRVATLEEWHRILGHANKTDILKLENTVDDMKITNKKDFQQCTTCIMSKTTNSHSRVPDKRASYPLELIHSDLSGPVDPAAKGGFRYAMNFVDDYSGATTVSLLKNKSDAVHALRKFLADSAPIGDVKKFRWR